MFSDSFKSKKLFIGLLSVVLLFPSVSALFGDDANYYIVQGSSGSSSFVYANYFNQYLNKSNSPTFEGFQLNSSQKSIGAEGVIGIKNNLTNSIVGAMIGITSHLYGGIWASFSYAPVMHTASSTQAFRFSPSWATAYNHNAVMLYMTPASHTVGKSDSLQAYDESGITRQFLAFGTPDASSVTYPWFSIGGAVSMGDSGFANVNYNENMITLTGGGTRVFGTNGYIRQRGIKFTGFGTRTGLISGTDYVRAVDADGGEFKYDNTVQNITNSQIWVDGKQGVTGTYNCDTFTNCLFVIKDGIIVEVTTS